MGQSERDSERLAGQLKELLICFPRVAPQLFQNLNLDRDLHFGFEGAALGELARCQVPFLLERLLEIGAVSRDEGTKGGYKFIQSYMVGRNKLSPAEKALLLKTYANVAEEKTADGYFNRFVVLQATLTKDTFEKVVEQVKPALMGIRNEPLGEETKGAWFVFSAVLEERI